MLYGLTYGLLLILGLIIGQSNAGQLNEFKISKAQLENFVQGSIKLLLTACTFTKRSLQLTFLRRQKLKKLVVTVDFFSFLCAVEIARNKCNFTHSFYFRLL